MFYTETARFKNALPRSPGNEQFDQRVKRSYSFNYMYLKFLLLILTLPILACSTGSLNYNEYTQKYAENKREFTLDKNYQQVFSELSEQLEKCEQKSFQMNNITVQSNMYEDKGVGEITVMITSALASYRASWIRIYKMSNKARLVIFSSAASWSDKMEKYSKGSGEKCL